MEDWLGELDKIRRTDEQQDDDELDLSLIGGQTNAVKLLHQVDAHNSLRKMRSVFLRNRGRIDIFDNSEQYDRCIGLIWQGRVSRPRNPSPDDASPYYYILVGVKNSTVYVNNRPLKSNTPEALKQALVAAAKKPGIQKRDKN